MESAPTTRTPGTRDRSVAADPPTADGTFVPSSSMTPESPLPAEPAKYFEPGLKPETTKRVVAPDSNTHASAWVARGRGWHNASLVPPPHATSVINAPRVDQLRPHATSVR